MEELKLYDISSGELSELIDNRKIKLRTKNKEYENLINEALKIKDAYPNILSLLEDNKVDSLNAEECKKLQILFDLYSKMLDYEEREIFFLGAKENYYYFKNLDLIK